MVKMVSEAGRVNLGWVIIEILKLFMCREVKNAQASLVDGADGEVHLRSLRTRKRCRLEGRLKLGRLPGRRAQDPPSWSADRRDAIAILNLSVRAREAGVTPFGE
jgi:hypothetical protein